MRAALEPAEGVAENAEGGWSVVNMIFSRGGISLRTIVFTIGVLAGVGFVVSEILQKREEK